MKAAVVTLPGIPHFGYLPPDVTVAIVLVEPHQAQQGLGDDIIKLVRPHFPTLPVMLVAVTNRGFTSYAHFQTHLLLAQLQTEKIDWIDIDLSRPPQDDRQLPF